MTEYLPPIEYAKYAFKGEFFEDQLVIAVTRDREDVQRLLRQADDNLAKVHSIYLEEVYRARKERGEARTRHTKSLDLFRELADKRLQPRGIRTRVGDHLRLAAGRFRYGLLEAIERYVRVPLLIRAENGTIHRKLKLTEGGFKYIVHFRHEVVWVRPNPSEPSGLEAHCVRKTLEDTRENRRYRAAALRIVIKDRR